MSTCNMIILTRRGFRNVSKGGEGRRLMGLGENFEKSMFVHGINVYKYKNLTKIYVM